MMKGLVAFARTVSRSGNDRTYREGSLEKEMVTLKKGGHSNHISILQEGGG